MINRCALELAGGSCTLVDRFSPAASGTFTSGITFDSEDARRQATRLAEV